jgi:hypothetical protein
MQYNKDNILGIKFTTHHPAMHKNDYASVREIVSVDTDTNTFDQVRVRNVDPPSLNGHTEGKSLADALNWLNTGAWREIGDTINNNYTLI